MILKTFDVESLCPTGISLRKGRHSSIVFLKTKEKNRERRSSPFSKGDTA
jgi:hypothetical protein